MEKPENCTLACFNGNEKAAATCSCLGPMSLYLDLEARRWQQGSVHKSLKFRTGSTGAPGTVAQPFPNYTTISACCLGCPTTKVVLPWETSRVPFEIRVSPLYAPTRRLLLSKRGCFFSFLRPTSPENRSDARVPFEIRVS